jgi:hypothetical protein
LSASVAAVSRRRVSVAAVRVASITTAENGPVARRSANAVLKLSRAASTAVSSPDDASSGRVNASRPISADKRSESRRRTRIPTLATRLESSGANAASSGVMRPAFPNSALTPFKSVAPSPKNQDGTSRLGKIGFEVTIGAPAAGSERVPSPAVRAATIPP